MKRRSEPGLHEQQQLREKILGFGEGSLRKSHYPELRVRLLELERFRFILDQIDLGILIIGMDHDIILDCNEETCRLFGKSRRDLVGTMIESHLHDHGWYRRLKAAGGGVETLPYHPSAGSSPRYLEAALHQVSFGGDAYLITITRDITDQKAASDTLLRTKDMFAAAFRLSHLPDASEGCILSEALQKTISLTQSRYGILGVVNPDTRFFTIYRSGPESGSRTGFSPIGKNGPWERILMGRGMPVIEGGTRMDLPITDGGSVVAIISLFEKAVPYDDLDLKQALYLGEILWQVILRRRAEERLRKLNAELEERVSRRTTELAIANSELEAFTYSVSHDLRTPLRSIDGFSLALLEDYDASLPPEASEYLHRIRAASQRMGDLIEDLLLLSRISRKEIRREQFSLSDLAAEVIADISSSEPRADASVHIQDGMIVTADRRMIRIALENLLGNAWKFTGGNEKTVISIGMRDDGITPVYIISDNGAGFDMAYAKKLFIPFSRLHAHEEFPGTGVGLATVSRIIRKHGGTIRAEAAVGGGATFYFTLGSKSETGE
ncbi:signal transduction histidine kinase [Methanocalculus alkaliphilus]|uniref:sensor histidine kinase n=1 Tax=Methanocalculus alkaliphilus TaxID=768730 RepID=UPI0020A0358C|nr:ATP-binding protein [Methanocalculus alkaliphilus]MCP1714931.1 signal transduction histidine kinase [Methanocalculus alkaliphilus]